MEFVIKYFCYCENIENVGTRKVEVLNSLIMKITAKAIDVNDIRRRFGNSCPQLQMH